MTTHRKPVVLVVEDHFPVNSAEKFKALEVMVDLRVDLARDFRAAREKLTKRRYDFVVSDLNFPSTSEKGVRFSKEDIKKFFSFLEKNSDPKLARDFEQAVGPYWSSGGDGKRDTPILAKWDERKFPIPFLHGDWRSGEYNPILGLLIARECQKKEIPHILWTDDFGHGFNAVLWAVGTGLVPAEEAGELVKGPNDPDISPFRMRYRGGLAFGEKDYIGNWVSCLEWVRKWID